MPDVCLQFYLDLHLRLLVNPSMHIISQGVEVSVGYAKFLPSNHVLEPEQGGPQPITTTTHSPKSDRIKKKKLSTTRLTENQHVTTTLERMSSIGQHTN